MAANANQPSRQQSRPMADGHNQPSSLTMELCRAVKLKNNMNESQNLACRVRPILEAIIEEARNQHADILTEQSWNSDYTLEISLRVREIRALAQLLKAGGREPTTPESTDVKALASATCSTALELMQLMCELRRNMDDAVTKINAENSTTPHFA